MKEVYLSENQEYIGKLTFMDGSHPVGEESDSDVVDSDNSESESCFDDLSSGEEVFGERMIRMPAPCDRCSRLICKDE
ncbi:hypothetical protein AWC38_SpisGene19164 [Stylophora pistillata]|uniref:Uncharacterized protein n=1 Tax=Stylophora pistillata TaxID=50429 RepID=A0A2B4RDV9_STYPI|nr:hypothetical protein AWC38_SpisGene19164 [Stylophora pistillata]